MLAVSGRSHAGRWALQVPGQRSKFFSGVQAVVLARQQIKDVGLWWQCFKFATILHSRRVSCNGLLWRGVLVEIDATTMLLPMSECFCRSVGAANQHREEQRSAPELRLSSVHRPGRPDLLLTLLPHSFVEFVQLVESICAVA